MHILLIEDDRPFAEALGLALRQVGYALGTVHYAKDAEFLLRTEVFDLIILDLGLPDHDGSYVLKYLRRNRNKTPVLVLSAHDTVEERVRLLDLGADDFVVKPITMYELEARVRALIRRSQGVTDGKISVGKLQLDIAGRQAFADATPLGLNSREWAVLEYMVMRVGRIVSRDQLLQATYSSDEANTRNAIEKIISRLRGKIPPGVVDISTVRGLGYILAPVTDEKN